MKWSPDGQKLIWITIFTDLESSAMEIQLWVADMESGDPKVLSTLGIPVEYGHPALWSPDGNMIAVLVVEEVSEHKEKANNIFLLDPETGAGQRLTSFTGKRLSYLQWSPDGKWLAFALPMGEYGEIWVASVDGQNQFPVAGPVLPNAPIIWKQ